MNFTLRWNSIFRYTHNWWHVALCYLEGGSPVGQVLTVYDEHIWNELEKSDASPPEVSHKWVSEFFTLSLQRRLIFLTCRYILVHWACCYEFMYVVKFIPSKIVFKSYQTESKIR